MKNLLLLLIPLLLLSSCVHQKTKSPIQTYTSSPSYAEWEELFPSALETLPSPTSLETSEPMSLLPETETPESNNIPITNPVILQEEPILEMNPIVPSLVPSDESSVTLEEDSPLLLQALPSTLPPVHNPTTNILEEEPKVVPAIDEEPEPILSFPVEETEPEDFPSLLRLCILLFSSTAVFALLSVLVRILMKKEPRESKEPTPPITEESSIEPLEYPVGIPTEDERQGE